MIYYEANNYEAAARLASLDEANWNQSERKVLKEIADPTGNCKHRQHGTGRLIWVPSKRAAFIFNYAANGHINIGRTTMKSKTAIITNAKHIVDLPHDQELYFSDGHQVWPGYDQYAGRLKRGYWFGTHSQHTYIDYSKAQVKEYLQQLDILTPKADEILSRPPLVAKRSKRDFVRQNPTSM